MKILIADDDEVDRASVRRALRGSGLKCQITEARTVEEAISACKANTFDCVIMDYRLPGQDGLTGLTLMRKQWPHMATVMLTGQGDEMVASEAMRRGASDYLSKSWLNQQIISHTVEKAIETTALRHKLAEQQEEVHTFNNRVVHDLKEPARANMFLATLIKKSIQDGQFEQAGNFCDQLISTTKHCQTLLQTLQEYTKLDAKVPFNVVDLNDVVTRTLINLEVLIKEREAQVMFGNLPIVLGNDALLIELFQNLISNSIKFCPERVPIISIGAQDHRQDKVLCTLTDNGIGIPEQYHLEIFKPFRRLYSRQEFEGTGLGLSTCKKIVEGHGGIIWCQSKLGEGTTFSFTLQADAKTADDALKAVT